MIKTPLSTMIGGAFWTPSATILGGTSKTFDQLIKSLFANNEQGFAYDPNDLTTMFQDAAGTIPVTGAGQPVGLMLDKSKGLVLGNNIGSVTWINSYPTRFDTFLSTSPDGFSATTTVAKAGIRTGIPCAIQEGKYYKIEFTATFTNATLASIWFSDEALGGMGAIQNPATATSGAPFSTIIRAPGDRSHLMMVINAAAASNFLLSNFKIRELHGNHAYQTTSASRPILRQNASTGAYYLEFDGSDDFFVTNNIDFTATDKVSLFAGVRKLGDGVAGVVAELSASLLSYNRSFYIAAPTQAGFADAGFASKGTEPSIKTVNGFAAPISIVISARSKISTGQNITKVNGVSASDAMIYQGTGNYGNYPLYIGRRGGAALPFNGHIYSLIGVGRLVTNAETTALEKLIAKNTGVTLSV